MDNNNQLLVLSLIDSTRYKKLRPLRYILYILSGSLISTLAGGGGRRSRQDPETSVSIAKLLHWNPKIIFVLFVIFVAISYYLYKYSKRHKRLGTLTINSQYIKINFHNQSEIFYDIDKIENFKISRGSTLHYSNKENSVQTNDSWIYFTENLINHQYEFAIENENENKNFEEMVFVLRKKYPKLYYESI